MSDLLRLDELLGPEERAVRDRVRAFCDEAVRGRAAEWWEAARFPSELLPGLARLGVCGGSVRGPGCPGLSPTAAGLVSLELARADGSLQTFWAVQSGLVMGAIARFGSDEQRQEWLPRLAALEAIGAFALTEPAHGSDVVALETRARRDGDGYVLDGAKRWIGNATFADVLVVWARDEDDRVGGFLVRRGAPGLTVGAIEGKGSQRAVPQADVVLTGLRAAAQDRLPGCGAFRDVAALLRSTRAGVAWAALGHALACYEAALAHAGARHQFGRPLAGFQLVQARLAQMAAETAAMTLICLRLGQLEAAGQLDDAAAALAKMNNARKARLIAAEARDILGGEGILLSRDVIRHQADLEAVATYEGTDSVQALIVGRALTGLSAFA